MNADIDEVKARVRRIETKVFLIGEKIGVDVKDNEPFKVTWDSEAPTMELPGMDVTLARIKRDLTIQGINPCVVGLYLAIDGKTVGYVEFMKEEV